MFPRNARRGRSATRTLLAISALLAAISTQAAPSQPLVLTAYVNGPAGRVLVGGQYESALRTLTRETQFPLATPAMVATNRCVAYTMTKDFGNAKVACDAAVKAARAERPYANTDVQAHVKYREGLALAYANRAVLRWLEKDGVNAAEDLAKGHQLAPKAEFIARNLAALQSRRGTIAQVTPLAR